MDETFGSDANLTQDVGSGCGKPTPCHDKKTNCGGYYWPVIIFVIIAILALLAILFTHKADGNAKVWTFVIALIFIIIWAVILWALCSSGQQALAWFLLLLPIMIAIFWYLAVFLASSTAPAECVMGGNK